MQEPLDELVETAEEAILSAIQVRSAHCPARHRDGWGDIPRSDPLHCVWLTECPPWTGAGAAETKGLPAGAGQAARRDGAGSSPRAGAVPAADRALRAAPALRT